MASSDAAVIVRVDEAVRAYDSLRINTYARHGDPANAIATAHVGGADLMRFPEVGYFNQVYGFGAEALERLPEIRDFFQGTTERFKVFVAPGPNADALQASLVAAGAEFAGRYVRLFLKNPEPAEMPEPVGFEIRRIEFWEVDAYFQMYLKGFGAPLSAVDSAVANMRLLHAAPGMHCLMAMQGGEPVGLGMLHVHAGVAHLCGGVVKDSHRGKGVQRFLINTRLRLAAAYGCELAISWSEEGSLSHQNLEVCGFSTAYVDPVLRLPVGSDLSPREET